MIAQTTSQPAEQVWSWLEYLHGLAAMVPVHVWMWIIGVGIGLIVVRRIWSAIWREIRLRRPVKIHPSLARYNVDRVEVQKQQRELAAGIIATSTSSRLAGYRLVRQVEAVFVEGFGSPEDALIALKAAAFERGANAILNVKTEHTAAGRCTASGDAVVVAQLSIGHVRPSMQAPPPSPPKSIG